jgi:cell wall-associated NlpC family hydrolase
MTDLSGATVEAIGRAVAAEARTWIHTPFRWQASVKGRGTDCKGLPVGVARELGLPEADMMHARIGDYRDDRAVDSVRLLDGMRTMFDRVDGPMQPGDLMVLKLKSGRAGHLAIVTEYDAAADDGKAVHAQIGPKNWVKETRIGALLHLFPLHSAWRWRAREAC